jgi:hypothetical protein
MGRSPSVLVASGPGERRREPLVEALDGDVEDSLQRLDESLGLLRLLAPLAPERQRQADDDSLRLLRADELCQLAQPVLGRRATS